jgi:hypothetical protein
MKLLLTCLVFISAISNVACAAGRKRVPIDPVTPSTVIDNDTTGLVQACGNQPIVGFTYCRVQEGDNSGQSISFLGPPAKCNQEDSCVFIKVWNQQSQLIWGGSIPKDQTSVKVPWKVLLSGRDQFQLGDRGFWTFNTQVFWLDPDGRERTSTSQGDILLRVYRKGYLPLHEVREDPNFVWEWHDGGFLYRMTSGLRAYIERKK